MKMTKMKVTMRIGYKKYIDDGSSANRSDGGYCRIRTTSANMQANENDDHNVIHPRYRNKKSKMIKTTKQYSKAPVSIYNTRKGYKHQRKKVLVFVVVENVDYDNNTGHRW